MSDGSTTSEERAALYNLHRIINGVMQMTAKKTYEVRRYMQNGGWAVVYRGPDLSKAAAVRDAMERATGRRAPVAISDRFLGTNFYGDMNDD